MDFSEPFITAEEAACFLKVNPFTVYKWALQRRIPSYKVGKSRRFKLSDLSQYMEQHKVLQR